MLGHYGTQFNSTEINYTFRQLPSSKTIQRGGADTPQAFKFSFKAPQRVTHFARLKNCADTVAALAEATSTLKAKQGPLLFQLPPDFKKDVALLEAFLAELPRGMKAAVEFRHESWLDSTVYEILGRHNTALCIAQSPEFDTPPEITASFGYLRLRREDYKPAQLRKWASWVRGQKDRWQEVFVYFNHEDTASGTDFARQFNEALADC